MRASGGRFGGRAGVGILLAAAVAAIGCAPPDVSGSWKGTWRLDWGLGEGDITMTLKQSEDVVTGSYDLDGSLCAEQGDVEGTIVDRDSVSLTLIGQAGGRVDVTGTLSASDDHIDGEFEVSEGWCGAGAEGNVDLTRK